ncbi:MAG: hypothetical protein ACYDGY_02900 [Acidimicrobiales bacterium]
MKGEWSPGLGMPTRGRRGVLGYLRKRRRSVLALVSAAVLAGVVAGGFAEVSGKPGPYASSIDLSYASLMQPVARNSSSLGVEILDLIYHPQGLSRTAMMDRVESMMQAASTEARDASNLVPPYPSGGSAQYCIRALTDRAIAASLFRNGVYGLLGGSVGNSSESVSSVLSRLVDASRMVASSDALWRRCAAKLRSSPGRARLQPSVWETVKLTTTSASTHSKALGTSSSSSSTTTSTSSRTTTTTASTASSSPARSSTTTSTSSSGGLSTSSSRAITGTGKSIVPGTGSVASSGVPPRSHSSHTATTTGQSSVQVLRWSYAALNAFVAAFVADTTLIAHRSVTISTYALSPSPLPSSTPGTLRIPPASSFSIQVVVGDNGNTYLPGVTVVGYVRCVSSGASNTTTGTTGSSANAGTSKAGNCGAAGAGATAGAIRMAVNTGQSPGGASLDPGATVAFNFRPVKVKPSWTYSVSITATSALPGVSSSMQLMLAVSPER